MIKNKIVICLFSLIFSKITFAELSCSANGTKIFYINGIDVQTQLENGVSANIVDRKVQAYKNQIDKNSNLPTVEGVYNYSTGLFEDMRKLREQLLLDADGSVTSDKRRKHFEELIKSELNLSESMSWQSLSIDERNKLDETLKRSLDYIYNTGDKDSLKYDDGNFTQLKLFKELAAFRKGVADLVAIAASDRQVVSQVKKKITDSILTKNQKVIFVAHSQGNEALRTSYYELRNDLSSNPSDLAKLDSIFGTLHVASPSPSYVLNNDKSQGIKLDTDLVISNSTIATLNNTPVSPNYYYDVDKTHFSFLKR
jgi:hypothetical protein